MTTPSPFACACLALSALSAVLDALGPLSAAAIAAALAILGALDGRPTVADLHACLSCLH
ncbi:hypothetical protein ASD78_15180 [Lysobacter sp. Root667]|uniref:hypothetical protein n=1 Tax=Lysobacter sp. Root667 TaxID=1736581 RepID=UPI0006FFB6F0|nr:hypothetical protein [Lysobacter sp. Root667]KRA72950.1 hypothetical protein ASD78_15180 [Lysobacter sp. Root667]